MNDDISPTARAELQRGLAESIDQMLNQPGATLFVTQFLQHRAVLVLTASSMLALPVDDLAATLRRFTDAAVPPPEPPDNGAYL